MEPTNAPKEYKWQALPPATLLYQGMGYNSSSAALVPSSGHLTHMPAHLFIRVGEYFAGVRTSLRTLANNQRYLKDCIHPYAYGHNLKLLVANARLAGCAEQPSRYG